MLDRYSAHRKAVRLLQESGADWFEVEWLPSYAPDLNPTEMLWNHTKYADSTNYIPDDAHDLRQTVHDSADATRKQGQPLRSFFEYAEPELGFVSFSVRRSINE